MPVCLSVCVSVCSVHGWAVQKCKNGWTDRYAVWQADSFEPKNPNILDGEQIPHGNGNFEGACAGPLQRIYAWVHSTGECVCPAHATDECIRRREGWQNGDAAFCQITLDTCYFVTLHYQSVCKPSVIVCLQWSTIYYNFYSWINKSHKMSRAAYLTLPFSPVFYVLRLVYFSL